MNGKNEINKPHKIKGYCGSIHARSKGKQGSL
jgi:hypothetical protein